MLHNTLHRIGRLYPGAVVIALLAAAGCATPSARIRRNPEAFSKLPADVQQKVKEGEVEIGFPKKAVYLALGEPDRVYRRDSEKGETLIWSYVHSYTDYSGTWWPRHRVLVTTGGGSYWYHTAVVDSFWHSRADREYEHLRIEFDNDKVIAIERLVEEG